MNIIFEWCNLSKPFWQKYHLHTTKDTLNRLTTFINESPDTNFDPIFKIHVAVSNANVAHDSVPDNKRLQYVLPKPVINEHLSPVSKDIQKIIKSIHPAFIPAHLSILWSKRGGKQQSEHADFSIFNFPSMIPRHLISGRLMKNLNQSKFSGVK